MMQGQPLLRSPATWLAFAAATLGAMACLWVAWCEFPFHAWNDMRLAPAFAVSLGINPYPLLGEGPLLTWIYGPVGILINLPATLANSAITALHMASLINATCVLGPLALLFFASPELRARGWAAGLFAFALAVLLVPRPNLVLQVADHCAIAAGLLANACLARRAIPSRRFLLLAAVATTLAIWSKQIAVFLPVAQVVYLAIHQNRALALRYVGILAGLNIVAALGFAWAFGWANLWFNLVAIPGQLGWADLLARLSLRPWLLAVQIGVPVFAMVVLWRSRCWPNGQAESGRSFQLGVLSFWAMLPIGLLGFFKAGGDINLIHSWSYWMPAAVLWWLVAAPAAVTKPIHLVAGVALALASHQTDLRSLPSRPFVQHFGVAAELAESHRGRLWFPQNPVLNYYLDDTLWHTEDGVSTRFLAGYGISEKAFRSHLPSPLDALVYPVANDSPFATRLLPELNRKFRYPYWMIYAPAEWEARPSDKP